LLRRGLRLCRGSLLRLALARFGVVRLGGLRLRLGDGGRLGMRLRFRRRRRAGGRRLRSALQRRRLGRSDFRLLGAEETAKILLASVGCAPPLSTVTTGPGCGGNVPGAGTLAGGMLPRSGQEDSVHAAVEAVLIGATKRWL